MAKTNGLLVLAYVVLFGLSMTTLEAQNELIDGPLIPEAIQIMEVPYGQELQERFTFDPRVLEAQKIGDHAAIQAAYNEIYYQLPLSVREQLGPIPPIVMTQEGPDIYERTASMALSHLDELERYYGVDFDPGLITPELFRQQATGQVSIVTQDSAHQVREAEVSEIPVPPVMSVEAALASLSADEADLLRGSEHLLVDRETFRKSTYSLPNEAIVAGLKVLRLRFPDPELQAIFEQRARLDEVNQQRGYYLEEEVLPTPEIVLMRVRQQQMRKVDERNTDGSIYRFFQTMEDYERETGRIAPWLPAYGVPVGTESYIGPWNIEGSASIYAESAFDAPLMVMKWPVDDSRFFNPNLIIFGRDASVVLVKHADGKWATRVLAFDGSVVYKVEVAAKLEGVQKDEFVRFATDILENYL